MNTDTANGGSMDFSDFNEYLANPTADFDADEQIDPEALFEKIRASVQSILKQKFPNDLARQEILERNNRINFACPSCGDSKHDRSKKRGNIYLNGYNFKCYNAESPWCAYTHSIVSFLSNFGVKDDYTSLEIAYLNKNTSENHQITLGSQGSSFSTHSVDMFGIDEFAIPREKIMRKLALQNVEDNEKIYEYLKGRKQIIGDLSHFAYDRFNEHLYVFNMTPDKQKVIGMQYRAQRLRNRRDQRFSSFMYSDIWEKVFGVTVKQEIIDRMDKFSLLYNILRVNYNRDIPIFEGAIDSHHMSNSLSTMGASSKIYLEMGKYFYDNPLEDRAGQKAAIEMLKQSHHVFLWGKFLHDYPQYRFCKDLNDIMIKAPISEEILYKYFGNNQMDIIYL